MTDIIKIPTANLTFWTESSSKKASLGDFNNDRQPEMAVETRNTCNNITETMKDTIDLPTADLDL